MFACACAHPSCQVNGCMRARQYREQYAQPQPAPLPTGMPPATFTPPPSLTEADVRRIFREEIERIFKGQP